MKKGFTTFLSALKANTPPCKKGLPSLRFLSLFLILFLAVGNVWADTQTYSFASSAELSNFTYTAGDASDSWAVYTAKQQNVSVRDGGFVQYKCGKSGKIATFVTTSSFDNITNISFFIASSDKGKTQVKIEVSSDASFSSDVTEIVNTTNGLSGLGISSPSNNTWYSVSKSFASKSGYVRFTMTSSSSGKYWSFDDIVITYTPSSGGDPVCPSGLTITSKDSKTAFLEGDAIELTAALSEGDGAITYQWYKGGTAEENKLAGKTAAKLEIASCVEGDAGDYYCVASKADCSDAVNATAFAITVAHNPCATHHWFVATADATANGKTNWSDFTNAPTGSNNQNNSVTIDGKTYTLTKRTGSVGGGQNIIGFTIPAGKVGTLYGYMKSSGSTGRTLSLKKDDDVIKTNTEITGSSWTLITIDAIAPGTYTLSPDQNVQVQMFVLKICDAVFHTVTFNSNGGSAVADLSVLDGTTATQPTDPERGKYTFLGWYNGETLYNWATPVASNLTLTAKWQNPWSITFDSNGGSAIEPITVKHNTKAEKPSDPTKVNYNFEGWFYGEPATPFDWNANITQDYTLKAQWIDDNNVARIGDTYYTNLDDAVAYANANADAEIILLKDIDRADRITLTKSTTINLNGNKLSKTDGGWLIFVKEGATLTINGETENSAVHGGISLGAMTNNNGSLVINGGTYTCADGVACVHVNGTCLESNVTINGANLNSPTDIAVQLNGKGTYTITNATITGATGVYIKSGELTVTNSTIEGTKAPADYAYTGNGANATGDAIVVDACDYPGGAPTLNIISGTFEGTKGAVGNYNYNGTSAPAIGGIQGGTFNTEVPADLCADGYIPVKNGENNYGVTKTAKTFSLEDLVTSEGTEAGYEEYLNNLGWSVANANALDKLNTEKDYDNYPYLGLKFKSAAGYVEGIVEGNKLLTIQLGHMAADADLYENGTKKVSLSGKDAETAAVHYYYVENQSTIKLQMTNDGTCVLKAITVADPYTVTFNANGGDAIEPMQGKPYITLPEPTNGTMNFKGWYDAETGGNLIGVAGASYTPTGNIELHAQWEAVSTDARLASITFSSDAGTLSPAFDPEVTEYTYTMPYGTAVPTITGATKANANAQAPVIGEAATAWGNAQTVKGVAQSGDTKTYTITMLRVPKDGTCIVKADLAAGSSAASITATSGAYKDADNIAINVAKDLKLGGTGAYVKVAVKDTYFQDGDVVEIVLRTDKSASAWLQIFADEGTTLVAEMKSGVSNATPNHLTISGVPENTSALYLYRTEAADGDMNPYPTSMAVYRAINPILKAITIDGRDGVIDPLDDKHFTVTIPNEADLDNLTIVPTIVRNAPHATTPEQVMTNSGEWVLTEDGNNTYRIMDKDGDYTDYTITLIRDVLKHTVSFNTHGGSAIDPVQVVDGQKLAAAPADPTREDYLFQGWAETEDGSIVDVTSFTISADKEFHAVWAPDGAIKLLNGATVNHTNFITGVTADETVAFMGNNVNYAKFSGTVSGVNGVKDLTRVIAYNATTNKTKIRIYAHNHSTSGRNILVKGLVEGATAAVDLATIALGNKEDKISDWIEFNNAANRTIYIMVSSSASDVYFTQVKVIESGETPMKQAGEAGYSLNFKKGRFFGLANKDLAFEGLNTRLSGDYTALNSDYAKLNATSMSFTVASAMTLSVTANNSKTYYVTKDAAGTDNETAKSGVSEFDLTAGTWYITAGSSEVQFTNIAFTAPKCEEPTVTDMENIGLCEGDAFTALTVSASVTDGGTLHYQWYKHPAEGDDEEVGTDADYYTPTADGQYYVIVTNKLADHSDNSKASNMVTVEHFASAEILSAPENVRMDAGETATLAVVATGKNVTYQWYKCDDEAGSNPVIIDGADEATYEVIVTDGMSQYYKVVVSSDCGSPVVAVVKVEEWTELPQANVTESIIWDWTVAAMNEVGTENDNTEYLMANVSSAVPNNENFRSDMLLITAEYANRNASNKCFQGWQIRFYTEVPGKVSLECRAIHEKVSITINGTVIDAERGGSMTPATTPFFVPAGWVTIVFDNTSTGQYADEPARVQKIVFNATPDYTREVRQGYYGTICLPNGGQMIGASLFELSYYNEAQGLLYMDEADATMVAGNPYIFLPNEGADKLYVFYTDEATAAAKTVNGLVGYLDNEDMQLEGNGTNYILKDNKIKKVVGGNNSNVFVTKNRAYIKLGAVNPNESAPVPGRRRVAIGQAPQVATGMESVDASAQPVKMIIDGQLFILRGEKMYDAQGKLVK